MAQTTVWVTKELLDRVRQKAAARTSKAIHAGFVVSLALDLWAKDLWNPGPDIEGLKDERLFLNLDDTSYIAALEKRQRTEASVSVVYRRALQDWVDGKWEIGLVRNGS